MTTHVGRLDGPALGLEGRPPVHGPAPAGQRRHPEVLQQQRPDPAVVRGRRGSHPRPHAAPQARTRRLQPHGGSQSINSSSLSYECSKTLTYYYKKWNILYILVLGMTTVCLQSDGVRQEQQQLATLRVHPGIASSRRCGGQTLPHSRNTVRQSKSRSRVSIGVYRSIG